MDPGAQTFRRLWIDIPLSYNAPERSLNVLSGAAEPIVEIQMAEGCVEVVAPKQSNHPTAEPDTFRVAGRAADLGRSLGKFIKSALRILGGIGGLTSLRRLVSGLAVAGLSKRRERSQRQNRRSECNGQDNRREGHDRAGFFRCLDDRD